MTGDWDNRGQRFFQELLEIVVTHPAWHWDESFSNGVETVARQAAEPGQVGEIRFWHSETDGVLYIRMPDLGTPAYALLGLLEQPLDPDLSSTSDLGRYLAEAHASIAGTGKGEYINPVEDPYTVLSIKVPFTYSEPLFRTGLSRAALISRFIKVLHSQVESPFNEFTECFSTEGH